MTIMVRFRKKELLEKDVIKTNGRNSLQSNLSSNSFRQNINNWIENEFASDYYYAFLIKEEFSKVEMILSLRLFAFTVSPLSVDSPPPENGTGLSMTHTLLGFVMWS